VAFSDVIDFLRDVTGANLFVNWRALETAGIDKAAPVTARLRDVKFSKALTTILNDVGGGTVKLAYTIDEGVITISTEEDLSKNVVTRVYDIRDLIINIPDFNNAPDFNITQANTGGGRGGGGGGGQSLFGGGGGQGQEENAGPTRQELVDSIIKLIQDTVASESWKDNGGTVGSLRELSGQLIVTQTPENQHQLVKLLEQLRETRAIQVTIEARFLKVQRNFLEDIGVDFDFAYNNTNPKWNGGGPIRFQQNSADFTAPAQLDTTLPGNLATVLAGASLSTAISYVDDFTVTALIRATQAEQSTSIITAPRVTLFNGQRAYVLVATTRAYVSDLQPVVGSNAVGFDPTISTVQSGVLLDVQATVSSDRKYVTLTLRPQLSNLLALVPFSIGGTTIIPDQASTQPFQGQGFIQQPEVQITEVRTTVSVPDGGTLLLGGQTLSGELEREAGVPVLSKIPFLKRLFTNRSMSHDDQVLLILVKPTIIIQREQEAKQFPLMKGKTS
jgi:general secretion pathway protein D